MKRISLLPLLAVVLFTPSCIFRVSAEDDPSLKMSGFGTAYAGYSGFDEWDGSLIQLGLLGGHRLRLQLLFCIDNRSFQRLRPAPSSAHKLDQVTSTIQQVSCDWRHYPDHHQRAGLGLTRINAKTDKHTHTHLNARLLTLGGNHSSLP